MFSSTSKVHSENQVSRNEPLQKNVSESLTDSSVGKLLQLLQSEKLISEHNSSCISSKLLNTATKVGCVILSLLRSNSYLKQIIRLVTEFNHSNHQFLRKICFNLLVPTFFNACMVELVLDQVCVVQSRYCVSVQQHNIDNGILDRVHILHKVMHNNNMMLFLLNEMKAF